MKALCAALLLVVIAGLAGKAQARKKIQQVCKDDDWTECSKTCNGGKRTCSREGNTFKIKCHMQRCKLVDKCKADVLFVLDSSSSLKEQGWAEIKQFAIDVIKGIPLGPDAARVGLVTFSGKAKLRIRFDEAQNHGDLADKIWKQKWMRSGTNTYKALLETENYIMRRNRPEVKSIVVLLTDGKSKKKIRKKVKPQAKQMHQNGIEIFAIGLGPEIKKKEVKNIAAKRTKHHAFFPENSKQLAKSIKKITTRICKAATTGVNCDRWKDQEWDACVPYENGCGEGKTSKSRECRVSFWKGGSTVYSFEQAREVPCWGAPCPPPNKPCQWSACSQPCGGGRRVCDKGDGSKPRKIRCNMHSCNEVDTCGPVDVVFVLDSSNSVGGKNWARMRQFAIDVSNGLPVSEEVVHVAAIAYSRSTQVLWELNDVIAQDKFGIEMLLWSSDWMRSRTNTQGALTAAKNLIDNSPRPSAKKVVIVITDGLSNVNKKNTIPAANALHDEGIKVFCLTVGAEDSEEFDAIASQPLETFRQSLKDYDALTDITSIITQNVCDVSQPQ